MRFVEQESLLLDFNSLPNASEGKGFGGSSPWCWGLVFIVRLVKLERLLLDFNCLPNALGG